MQTGNHGCLHLFQSTHPARGATEEERKAILAVAVSIHAPREGCDRDRL